MGITHHRPSVARPAPGPRAHPDSRGRRRGSGRDGAERADRERHERHEQDHPLAIVEDLGLDIDEMMVLVSTVRALVHGYVTDELSGQEATRRSGLDTDGWMESVAAYGGEIIERNAYPRVARVLLDAEGPHAANRAERDFTLGLDRVLDGFAVSLAPAAARRGFQRRGARRA
jgi:hypothetical protein